MSTHRSEPVVEPVCCPRHTDTCGLEDWCCDACSEAGLVASNRNGRRLQPLARPYVPVVRADKMGGAK